MSEVRIHLSREIISDLWRHKLQVVLTLAVLITAFAVILVTNMTRGLTAKQNDLMAEEDRLNIEWRHLLLEQGTLAEHSRVASLAMDKLQMARPLVTSGLGDWQTEGRKLLDLINTARAEPRQCGTQAFTATAPLSWNDTLAGAANSHTRNMANGNFFDHLDPDGRTPGDRAELAGYIAKNIGENIAAGLDTPRKVVDGWLASPGHCANLMNPQFRELGAAYAMDPKSDAGIYWTGLFGTQ